MSSLLSSFLSSFFLSNEITHVVLLLVWNSFMCTNSSCTAMPSKRHYFLPVDSLLELAGCMGVMQWMVCKVAISNLCTHLSYNGRQYDNTLCPSGFAWYQQLCRGFFNGCKKELCSVLYLDVRTHLYTTFIKLSIVLLWTTPIVEWLRPCTRNLNYFDHVWT